MARPQKTGAAPRPATAGEAAAVLQFEWIVFGYTAEVSGPRRGVGSQRWKVSRSSGLARTLTGPIESE